MRNIRTDLAVEAHEYYTKDYSGSGVKADTEFFGDVSITTVKVINEEGEKLLHKKKGNYITVEVANMKYISDENRDKVQELIGEKLENMLSELGIDNNILIVGLGNRDITPDALGPKTVEGIDVTRHLFEYMPQYVRKGAKSVSAIAPGVLGNTGIETLEIIKGITERTKPEAVIAIDALAARDTRRVGNTIQLADTGIHPGSGVGNHRKGLNRETLGVPVIAIGVPTVVDAATIADDAIEALAQDSGIAMPDKLKEDSRYHTLRKCMGDNMASMMVTPKEIDSIITDIALILSGGISKGLHKITDSE